MFDLSYSGFDDIMKYWSFVVSTVLACISISNAWNDRFRISIACLFTGLESEGNEIKIRNLSKKRLIISGYELFYSSGVWPFAKLETITSSEYDFKDIIIDSCSTATLSFYGQNYFSTSYKARNGRKIYIKLFIVDKGPVIKLVS